MVIGHSLGCAFLLNVLEKANKPVKSAFLVAGFVSAINNPKLDAINRSFWDKKFDWKKIKSNCRNFIVYHSDNDPYVSLEKGNELAEQLGSSLKIIKNAGHFNKNSGYLKFDMLLEDVKNTLQNYKKSI
ncbi:alpha/beta hydrolase [archaeon]|nr:alpha/beta hydrolase [archaeon]